MSNMENLQSELVENLRRQQVFDNAVELIKQEQIRRAAGGYAVMAAALSYGESALGDGRFGRISHYAKLFCIGFAFLVPSLLLWRVVL